MVTAILIIINRLAIVNCGQGDSIPIRIASAGNKLKNMPMFGTTAATASANGFMVGKTDNNSFAGGSRNKLYERMSPATGLPESIEMTPAPAKIADMPTDAYTGNMRTCTSHTPKRMPEIKNTPTANTVAASTPRRIPPVILPKIKVDLVSGFVSNSSASPLLKIRGKIVNVEKNTITENIPPNPATTFDKSIVAKVRMAVLSMVISVTPP